MSKVFWEMHFTFYHPEKRMKNAKNDSISNAGASKFYFESHIKIYLANKPEIRSNYVLLSPIKLFLFKITAKFIWI
jgi:hypothetical protein